MSPFASMVRHTFSNGQAASFPAIQALYEMA